MDLTRKQLLVALEELDRQLGYSGVEAELRVVGGAAMALLYDEARTTADIDSVFDDYEVVRAAVEAAARELHLPPDWVNSQIHDLALPFERDHHARVLRIGENLTVRIASPQFLLYTKIIARRDAEQDFEDAVTLARHLNLVSAEQIEAEVSVFGQIDGPLELYVEEIAREL